MPEITTSPTQSSTTVSTVPPVTGAFKPGLRVTWKQPGKPDQPGIISAVSPAAVFVKLDVVRDAAAVAGIAVVPIRCLPDDLTLLADSSAK